MASTDNVGTLSFLAKITTFLVALFCWFYVGTSSILLVTGRFEHDHYWIWMPIILMAYFVLEFVGIRSKIPRLIIFSCVIWTYITWYSIRNLINVSQLPIKGWVSYSRISNHSINFIKLTNLYHWFIFDCRNYNLIWAVPFMLFAFFKAEVQIQLAEEMMKETREEPLIPPTMEKV